MTDPPSPNDAWPMLELAGIEVRPHPKAPGRWRWRVAGLHDWAGPCETSDEALGAALAMLVAHAAGCSITQRRSALAATTTIITPSFAQEVAA